MLSILITLEPSTYSRRFLTSTRVRQFTVPIHIYIYIFMIIAKNSSRRASRCRLYTSTFTTIIRFFSSPCAVLYIYIYIWWHFTKLKRNPVYSLALYNMRVEARIIECQTSVYSWRSGRRLLFWDEPLICPSTDFLSKNNIT